ncbi:PDDEXK nuclease domain-containing protein [Prevotella sp.]
MHVYVVIEPKATLFKSAYMIQLTIYTNVMDKTLYDEHYGKNSGLLLCNNSYKVVFQHALFDYD